MTSVVAAGPWLLGRIKPGDPDKDAVFDEIDRVLRGPTVRAVKPG